MKGEIIKKLQTYFDALAHLVPEEKVEFWFARDLQDPLGYVRWENFIIAIKRAIESCKTTGYDPSDHFRGVTKMVTIIFTNVVWTMLALVVSAPREMVPFLAAIQRRR